MKFKLEQSTVKLLRFKSPFIECTAHCISMYHDKNCQSTLCYDKNCQDTRCVHMQPVKPAMTNSSHMWLAKPAKLQYSYKKKDKVKKNIFV